MSVDKSQFKETLQQRLDSNPHVKAELPSEGIYYSKDSVLSKGVVHLRYMKGEDEEILLSPKHIKENTFVEALLQKLVLEPEFDVYEMALGDRMYLMLFARIMSLGSGFLVPSLTCPMCGETEKDVQFDVTDIQDAIIKFPPIEPHTNKFKTTLEQSGYDVVVSATTGETEKRLEDRRKKMQQVNNEFTISNGMAELIVSTTGIDSEEPTYGQKVKFVKELPIKDSRQLRKFVNDINGVPDNRLPHKCSNCEHEYKVPIEFGLSFFFPEI